MTERVMTHDIAKKALVGCDQKQATVQGTLDLKHRTPTAILATVGVCKEWVAIKHVTIHHETSVKSPPGSFSVYVISRKYMF